MYTRVLLTEGQLTVLNDNIIWKEIPEFEGHYEVSNTGIVRSIGRVVPNSETGVRYSKAKEIVANPTTRSPYLYVKLYKHNVMHGRAVHRCVALAFIPNPDGKEQVNHKDGNKLNNSVENLEWCTRLENIRHGIAMGFSDERFANHAILMVGTKGNSAVSKYHNVSYDRTRDRWMASIKQQGKPLFQKRFKQEDDAARYVNEMIDKLQLNRPKNIIV